MGSGIPIKNSTRIQAQGFAARKSGKNFAGNLITSLDDGKKHGNLHLERKIQININAFFSPPLSRSMKTEKRNKLKKILPPFLGMTNGTPTRPTCRLDYPRQALVNNN